MDAITPLTAVKIALISASMAFNLPPGLLSATCFVESAHKPAAIHLDDGGESSRGLCQLHESTAKGLGYRGTAEGLMNPKANAHYAAKYLRFQLDRYHGDIHKAVGAYNSGTYRENAKGDPVNKRYIKNVLSAWKDHR